jgi:hypothetical protein
MASKDLSRLSDRVRDAARIDTITEVSWPLALVADAINELAACGCIVLGLDLRDYDPEGHFLEAAWSVYRGREPFNGLDVEPARLSALAGVNRALNEANGWREPWLLVTWQPAVSTR